MSSKNVFCNTMACVMLKISLLVEPKHGYFLLLHSAALTLSSFFSLDPLIGKLPNAGNVCIPSREGPNLHNQMLQGGEIYGLVSKMLPANYNSSCG